jgi:hypothetical protein
MEEYDNAWAIHSYTGCPNHQKKEHIALAYSVTT